MVPFRLRAACLALTGIGLTIGCMPVMAGGNEPIDLLEKISRSAREMSYAGVYVHQTPDGTSTLRISHSLDKDGMEREKIESLDGPPSEIIRSNEEMICYQPDARTVRIDRRGSGRFFPSLISGSPKAIAENYQLKVGNVERIAGYDCRWLILEPRDAMRYLQKLCAELSTGLLLRARTFNERNQLVEQFSFTQVDMSSPLPKQSLRSRFEQAIGWQKDVAVNPQAKDVDTGWKVGNLPAGFRKVMEMVRSLGGRPQPVAHLVFSDGVSNVSVFAEAAPGPVKVTAAGTSDDSPTSFAMRSVADYQVTVVGEVPLAAVQTIADGVTRRTR